jgi:hypothetical protein
MVKKYVEEKGGMYIITKHDYCGPEGCDAA